MMKSNFLFFALLITVLSHSAPPADEGKTIFTTRCASCHNVNKQVLGPALAGIDQRRSLEWIVNFVRSSQTVIQKGDKEAIALFRQFNNIPMPDHKDLSDGQIKNVVDYINSEAIAAGVSKPVKTETTQPSLGLLQEILESPALVLIFSMLVMLLLGVLLFSLQVTQYKKRIIAGK